MTQKNKEQECKKCGRVFGSVRCFDIDCPNNTPKITMNQEEKDSLVQDLCARLPYEVKVQYEDGIFTIDYISAMYEEVKLNTPNNYTIDILDIKPYLLPLSSMTEEQKQELDQAIELELKAISDEIDHAQVTAFEIDFYNKHHFDWMYEHEVWASDKVYQSDHCQIGDLQHYIESLKRDMFEILSIKSNLYNLRQHEIKTVYKAQVE